MGREIKRVPLNFNWPIGKIWPGYMLSICSEMEYVEKDDSKRCDLCIKFAKIMRYPKNKNYECPEFTFRDPPKGKGYQFWETVSEGSPRSPVFDTPEKLAEWLFENKASTCGFQTTTYENWLKFIKSDAWSVSMVLEKGEIKSGVDFVAENNKEIK